MPLCSLTGDMSPCPAVAF